MLGLTELHRAAQRALNNKRYREAHGNCLEILTRNPEFADAYFLLGMIALAHGHVRKALELVDRALRHDSDNVEYLAHRAQCLVLLGDDAAALEAGRRAAALGSDNPLTLDTIGVALSKAGDHETAIECFSEAARLEPGNSQFHFNLASSQEFLGRFEAAEASYEEAIRLRPDFHRAHWALSELTRATPEHNHIERLENLLADAPRDSDAELYLCHALAKEYEQLGEYAKAFELWERGKRAKRGSMGFSLADYRELFDAIMSVCSADFFVAAQAESACASAEPIFVVGMPRTGTTLVDRILASHDDVYSAGELNEFGLALKSATETTSNRVLDAETVRKAAVIDFRALGEHYIASTRPRTGHTKHFIDKLPPNFLYAGFIGRALPDAKIICLRRNPLDTCLSNYRQLFSINAPYYSYAYDLMVTGHYYLMFDALVKHWERVLPRNFLVVRYEDVVADVESQARRLLEFCRLEWDPKVLDFHVNEAAVATASAVQVRQPIYTTALQRWKKYERQLTPLVELFSKYGIEYG